MANALGAAFACSEAIVVGAAVRGTVKDNVGTENPLGGDNGDLFMKEGEGAHRNTSVGGGGKAVALLAGGSLFAEAEEARGQVQAELDRVRIARDKVEARLGMAQRELEDARDLSESQEQTRQQLEREIKVLQGENSALAEAVAATNAVSERPSYASDVALSEQPFSRLQGVLGEQASRYTASSLE